MKPPISLKPRQHRAMPHLPRENVGMGSVPVWAWQPQAGRAHVLCTILCGLFASYLVLYCYATFQHWTPFPFGDFFSLWSYPRIALDHPAAELYDLAKLRAAQEALGMPRDAYYLFAYPPTFLLFLWPLGHLPYLVSYALWIGGTLLLYVAAICVGGRTPPAVVAAAVLAPTTTINAVAGQSGFLLAALLIGGLRLAGTRPILAGVLLGLATYKPQFGLLVPVALVAAKEWRCIAAACVTAAALIAVTCGVFGASIWPSWLHAFPAAAAQFSALLTGNRLMPTVTANLQMLGVSSEPTRLIQGAAACLAVVLVWAAFRRPQRVLAIPMLCAATFLATPYAFIYDLPLLTGAVLLFVADRCHAGLPFVLPEIVVLIIALAFPVVMVWGDVHAPVGTVAIALFVVLILRVQARRPQPRLARPSRAVPAI